jgi:hypothetical protein
VISFVPCLSIATFLATFSSSSILCSLHLFCFWSHINNCVDPILYVYFKNDFSILLAQGEHEAHIITLEPLGFYKI